MNILQRIEKTRSAMAENGISAILISNHKNRLYLSGFSGSSGFLIITPSKLFLATDFRYSEQAKQQTPLFNLFEISGEMSKWLPAWLDTIGTSELAFESSDITFEKHSQMESILSSIGVKLKPSSGIIENIRKTKEAEEIELIRKAAAICDDAMSHIANILLPGKTEREIAWEIESYLRLHESQTLPFEVIVAAGNNASMPHHRPSDYLLKTNEPIIIDFGANYLGYASDITRTFFLGKPTEQYCRIYETVLKAQEVSLSSIHSGISGKDADRLARTVIKSAGYGECFGHGLGHGLGLDIHESPRLGSLSSDILADGMVFTVEPGIYIPGWGGVRIEDSVTLKDGKISVLSHAKK